jgi:hypothetical protein
MPCGMPRGFSYQNRRRRRSSSPYKRSAAAGEHRRGGPARIGDGQGVGSTSRLTDKPFIGAWC